MHTGGLNIYNMYMEVRTSPLLVAQAPYDIKEVELGPSHFIGWQACRMQYPRLDVGTIFFKKEARFAYCLAFYFLTVAKVSQLE